MLNKKVIVDGYSIRERADGTPWNGGGNLIIERQGKTCIHGYWLSHEDKANKTPEQIGWDVLDDFFVSAYIGSKCYDWYIDWIGEEYEDSKASHAEYRRANRGLFRLDPHGAEDALTRGKLKFERLRG